MSEYSEIYCHISCQNIPKYIAIYHVRIFPNILSLSCQNIPKFIVIYHVRIFRNIFPYIMSEYSQIYCHISSQNIPKYIAIYHVRIFPNILSYIMSEYSEIYFNISWFCLKSRNNLLYVSVTP